MYGGAACCLATMCRPHRRRPPPPRGHLSGIPFDFIHRLVYSVKITTCDEGVQIWMFVYCKKGGQINGMWHRWRCSEKEKYVVVSFVFLQNPQTLQCSLEIQVNSTLCHTRQGVRAFQNHSFIMLVPGPDMKTLSYLSVARTVSFKSFSGFSMFATILNIRCRVITWVALLICWQCDALYTLPW